MKKDKTFDIEILPNYALFSFMDEKGKVTKIERINDGTLDKEKLRLELEKHRIFTFNGVRYDIPITSFALSGASNIDLYHLSRDLIQGKKKPWQVMKLFPLDITHVDLSEPSPGVMISLKLYGCRLGSKKLWEFPVNYDENTTKHTRTMLRNYCGNDLRVTWDLYQAIKGRIELREAMSKEYNIDLMSLSDAQIAEKILVNELGAWKAEPDKPSSVRYRPPGYIKFNTKKLHGLLKLMGSITYKINEKNGSVMFPKELEEVSIVIGETRYKVGIGGLHSQEHRLVVESNDEYTMRNADVASYYPSIIIRDRLYPNHLGPDFLDTYINIYERRLKAKHEGNKLVADSLKIVLNGSYGKLGSIYSKLYSPDLMLAVTLTGQLTLLMLIEKLEAKGIRVVSANTDGIEYYVRREEVGRAEKIIKKWEKRTGYIMEHGEYDGLYAKDVNNYVAKYGNKVKAKGSYAVPDLSKSPQFPICYEAVRQYIATGKDLEETIRECRDVTQFLSSRKVAGGAIWKGGEIGSVVRWYIATDGEMITYKKSGNKVPLTDDAYPLPDLPDEIPNNIDYDWYLLYAEEQLRNLGVKEIYD